MANEIKITGTISNARGIHALGVYFLYDLSAPADRIEDANGNPVVVTHSNLFAGIKPIPDGNGLLSAGEVAALDAGSAAAEFHELTTTEPETLVAFRTRVQAFYTFRRAQFIAEMQAKHAFDLLQVDQ